MFLKLHSPAILSLDSQMAKAHHNKNRTAISCDWEKNLAIDGLCWSNASNCDHQLIAQSLRHLQPHGKHFQLQRDCSFHLVGGNRSPRDYGLPQIDCIIVWQIGEGLQITAMLFINADKLPTSCNQSESASANDSNLFASLYFENGHSTQPIAIWLYSGYLQCCQRQSR